MQETNQRTVGVSYSRIRFILRAGVIIWLAAMLVAMPVVAQAPTDARTSSTSGVVYQDGEVNATACAFGPPIPGQDSDPEERPLEVALVNDESESMATGSRMEDLKNAATEFVGQLNSTDESAAISFSVSANVDQSLTTNHSATIDAIESLSPDSGTDMSAGISAGHTDLTESANASDNATKAMLFITDGGVQNSSDTAQEIIDAADAAKADGITIFVVGLGDEVNQTVMGEVATGDNLYVSPDSDELDTIYQELTGEVESIQETQIRVDTRQLYQPGETHPYSVRKVTYEDNRSVWTNVTENSSVASSNETILSVDESTHSMEATQDANTSTWVRVNATHNGIDGCTNVIVSQPTVENLQLVPGIWRIVAVANDPTLFALLIAVLLAVPAARFTSAFGGLAVAQMVVVVGWFAGYIGFGIAASSLFVALFIGLNLAANIQYTAGGRFQ